MNPTSRCLIALALVAFVAGGCEDDPADESYDATSGQTAQAHGDAAPPDPEPDSESDSAPDSDSTPDSDSDSATDSAPEPDSAPDSESDSAADSAPDTGPEPDPWASPIVVSTFPFTYSGDTTGLPSFVDAYAPCAPLTDESGGELVFEVQVSEADKVLSVAVDDVSGDGVDVDVHLLEGPSGDQCVKRHNVALSHAVDPGLWYVAVDTWVNASGLALAGPFTLTIDLVEGGPGPDPSDCLTNPILCTEADTPAVNGVPTEPAGLDGCPPGMARVASAALGDFCVDRWEAALVKVEGDGSLSPWSPFSYPGDTPVRAVSAPGLVPQGYVTQIAATAACEAAGKRLCSNAEWLRACQGEVATTYPYGATLQPGVCNDDRECHPVVQYFESGASWVWSELAHPCINQLPDSVHTTGANEGCVSEDGLYDMMGNLHEWTSDPSGTFRGGFYADTVVNGPGCLYATTAHNVYHWDYSTGFRCCADL